MYDYDDYYDRECEGVADGCDGCGGCTESTQTTRKVVARAPRSPAGVARRAANGIRPGDTIRVTTGFEYQKGGGRFGYFGPYEVLVSRGKAWSPEEREQFELQKKIRAVHHGFSFWEGCSLPGIIAEVREFEDRTGLRLEWGAWNGVPTTTALMEQALEDYKERQRTAALRKAEWEGVLSARTGDEVEFRGQTWVKGKGWAKPTYHSSAEYMGELCDATIHWYFRLTPVGGGDSIVSCDNRMPRL